MVICPTCEHENVSGSNFCAQCGTPLRPDMADATRVITGVVDEALTEELSAADVAAIGALASGAALLMVLRGPNAGARYLLDADVVTAGRQPNSDIFLDDVTVSRRHARFTRHDGRMWVSDEHSLNGTYVNRERIEGETALRVGDEVQIGKFRLVFFPGPSGGR